MARASPEAAGGIQPGQRWAYRARQVDELVEVSVVRLGTQQPARVLVRFVDDAFEGREEWVPPARLKVRWGSVDQYRAREERWDRIHAAGLSPDDPREDAAERVIEIIFDLIPQCTRRHVKGYWSASAVACRSPATPGRRTISGSVLAAAMPHRDDGDQSQRRPYRPPRGGAEPPGCRPGGAASGGLRARRPILTSARRPLCRLCP